MFRPPDYGVKRPIKSTETLIGKTGLVDKGTDDLIEGFADCTNEFVI